MSNLSIGIVGLPNVGKSTLFNALLKQQLAVAANYPFATIEPNTGIAEVPDGRLAVLAKIVGTEVIKPATVEFIDIAGLVAGASKGEGLGNKFLANIRETAIICHVLRDFSDEGIIREGSVGPVEDLAVIRTELQLADLATLEKQKMPKGAMSSEVKEEWQAIEKMRAVLEAGKMINSLWGKESGIGEEEKEKLMTVARNLNLLTSKNEIFVLNVAEEEMTEALRNKEGRARELGVDVKKLVLVSAKVESELAGLTGEEAEMFLAEMGLEESGLERLARVAYDELELQSFLTAGEIEVRAWTIKRGMLAPEASGVIHTDFANKFIKANVASFEDFVEYKGWKGVKEFGKMRMEGKEYVMQDGDVVEFMIGK